MTTTYTIEKYVREDTDAYGKAGEVEWHIVNIKTQEVVQIYPLRRMAKEALAAAKRSASLMKKVSNNTCPPKTPDAVPADGIKSALVLITMPYKLPAVALPIMKPVTVTVTPVFAAID